MFYGAIIGIAFAVYNYAYFASLNYIGIGEFNSHRAFMIVIMLVSNFHLHLESTSHIIW